MQINNVFDNKNMICIANSGSFYVYEHQRDLSVMPWDSSRAYFMKEMNVKRRQVLASLNGNSIKIQAGAMQWIAGNIQASSGVKGVGDFLGKAFKGAVTGESAAKPIYTGQGYMMLEPTYRFLLIEDVGSWGQGMVLDDGLFLVFRYRRHPVLHLGHGPGLRLCSRLRRGLGKRRTRQKCQDEENANHLFHVNRPLYAHW